MKETGKLTILAVNFGILVILLFLCVFHCWRRYHLLNEIARLPLARQRMALHPSSKMLQQSGEMGVFVDLGYCKFTIPPGPVLHVRPRGVHQTSVSLTNEMLSIVFLAPFSEEPMIGVTAEIKAEETMYPNFWQAMVLSQEQFYSLVVTLAAKASTTRGWNEMFSYATSNTVGLVRIGDSSDDRLHASVSISATSGNRHVGLHLEVKPDSDVSIEKVLDDMLSSFEFTIDSIPDNQQIAKLIREANLEAEWCNLRWSYGPRRIWTEPIASALEILKIRGKEAKEIERWMNTISPLL